MKLEYNFYKVEEDYEDGYSYTFYIKQGVWQTRPYNATEITEEEYNSKTN